MSSTAEDENQEVLQRMRENGDDLNTSRPIEFNIVFPNETSAQSFSHFAQLRGFHTYIEETCCVPDFPWDVIATSNMLPELATITETEATLDRLAAAHGGRVDGWGCLAPGN